MLAKGRHVATQQRANLIGEFLLSLVAVVTGCSLCLCDNNFIKFFEFELSSIYVVLELNFVVLLLRVKTIFVYLISI